MKTLNLSMPTVPEHHRDQTDVVLARNAAIARAKKDGWDMLYVCSGTDAEYLVLPDDVEPHVGALLGVLPLTRETDLTILLGEDAQWLKDRGVDIAELSVFRGVGAE